jgi:hypothetical protein
MGVSCPRSILPSRSLNKPYLNGPVYEDGGVMELIDDPGLETVIHGMQSPYRADIQGGRVVDLLCHTSICIDSGIR